MCVHGAVTHVAHRVRAALSGQRRREPVEAPSGPCRGSADEPGHVRRSRRGSHESPSRGCGRLRGTAAHHPAQVLASGAVCSSVFTPPSAGKGRPPKPSFHLTSRGRTGLTLLPDTDMRPQTVMCSSLRNRSAKVRPVTVEPATNFAMALTIVDMASFDAAPMASVAGVRLVTPLFQLQLLPRAGRFRRGVPAPGGSRVRCGSRSTGPALWVGTYGVPGADVHRPGKIRSAKVAFPGLVLSTELPRSPSSGWSCRHGRSR